MYKLGKNPCNRCGSKDNFHWYGEDRGGYCWGCDFTIPSLERRMQNADFSEEDTWDVAEFNEEDHEKLKKNTSFNPKNFRGLREDVCKYFGVRHEYSPETGELLRQYYPNTKEGKFSGYKVRGIPKTFSVLGEVDNECELVGQFRFTNSNSKMCLLVAGEVDLLSAYQMLRDYSESKGSGGYEPIPVVSPSTGENGCVSQIKAQYAWFDRFDKIIVCFDNDAVGKKAAEKVTKCLPKGKAYIMSLSLKDSNEYLMANRQKEWISAFFSAKLWTPSGVVGSNDVLQQIQERVMIPKISMPPFLNTLNRMTAGGIGLKQIVNIVAGTSIGKTTLVNAMVKHWIFNSPYKVGIVTLEADVPEYCSLLLSEHIGRKLSLIEDKTILDCLLKSPEVEEKANELFTKEDGSPRFFLLDDRGDFDSLQDKIEELVISCGVQMIVLDPLSDVLASLPPDQQEAHMKWQKSMIKAHDMTFINVVHIRKAGSGQKDAGRGADLDESMMFGSSSIAKSAHMNILLSRDKYAEDEMIRNTTKVVVAKNRTNGITGNACEIYYDNQTHRLWDKEEYLKAHAVNF